ncbi:MAG: DUF4432 family protein, partial [Spirochaetota bacterium]
LEYGGLSARGFVYPGGVRGVRLENDVGHVELLPFKGQQIWDAWFQGRRLTMRSPVQHPRRTDFFLHTYGCFMMHCGALRMGCPGPEDDHRLHGELPCAEYQDTAILFGSDEGGDWIALSGAYYHDTAFTAHYLARPRVTMRAGSSLLEITMEIVNRSSYPMDLMYMCHVNFRPVEGGRIVQSAGWDPGSMRLRRSVPRHVQVSEEYLAFIAKLEQDPDLTRVIRSGDQYNPEVAFFMDMVRADREGMAHFMQVHPDGTADYIGYRPRELGHATRWITRTADQEALGVALPATCDPEGYTAEKNKGNLKQVDGGSTVTFTVTTGYLDQERAEDMERRIAAITG